eukprot:COSAG02_NODE_14658_length_1250_cov_5.449222_2_plen_81_part_01
MSSDLLPSNNHRAKRIANETGQQRSDTSSEKDASDDDPTTSEEESSVDGGESIDRETSSNDGTRGEGHFDVTRRRSSIEEG